jgi:hypothetical protein
VYVFSTLFSCKIIGFSVVCHGCGKLLYEGRDLIPLYCLRRRTDGKCPVCGRKLGVDPKSIEFKSCEK